MPASGPARRAAWDSTAEMWPAQLRRNERGITLTSPLALLSGAAIVVAGAAFLLSDPPTPPPETLRSVQGTPAVGPTTRPPRAQPPHRSHSARPTKKHKPAPRTPKPQPVSRGEVYVEVFNNTGITGLAGSTASRIAGAGWQVVGSDNWYGAIPASTVYYPERLAKEAKLLAKDLGIGRIEPAISPMQFDRLTVILTTDYA